MSAALLSQFEALLDRPGLPTTSIVERGAVTRFAEAIGEPILLGDDEEPCVPPTFLASLPYQREPLPGAADNHLINAENTFTFIRSPIVGEPITTVAAFTSVLKRGPWLRLGLGVRYTDVGGALVGSVTVQFIVDVEGICAAGLRDATGSRAAPTVVEAPFVPHGVARPSSGLSAARGWADLDWGMRRPGDLLPPLRKAPLTALQFVQYAGASGDFNPLHYDGRFAARAGFPDVLAPGLLKMAFFAQHMTLCAGSSARLRRLEAQYLGFDVPGQELTSCATVRDVLCSEGQRTLEIELSLRDRSGDVSTVGSATIEVLARAMAAT